MSTARIAITILAAAMSGCTSSWLPWGQADKELPRRLPDGAVEFACAQGRSLVLRHAADGKSVWVIYPDREFRLDRTGATSVERYTNGLTTLTVEPDGIAIDGDGTRQFAGCKRKGS